MPRAKPAADERHQRVASIACELRARGATLLQIVEELNYRGYRTRRGNPWSITSVWRLLQDRRTGGAFHRGTGGV